MYYYYTTFNNIYFARNGKMNSLLDIKPIRFDKAMNGIRILSSTEN